MGNQTRDLPACSTMLQPTLLPRAPIDWYKSTNSSSFKGNDLDFLKMSQHLSEGSHRLQAVYLQARRWFRSYTSDKYIFLYFTNFCLAASLRSSFSADLQQFALHFSLQPSRQSSRRSLGVNQQSHHTINTYISPLLFHQVKQYKRTLIAT
jgi:hypothetical protein